MKPYHCALLAFAFWACDESSTRTSDTSGGNCREAARVAAPSSPSSVGMVQIPAGCRNFTEPGEAYKPGNEYACVDSFWMDSVETTIAAYQSIMGSGEAALHNSTKDPCPQCPMDDLTYFEAVLLANARTKREIAPSETVYTYQSIVSSKTLNSNFKTIKPKEITDLVGLAADTTRKGYRLPSRNQYAWAAIQNMYDFIGNSDSVDALHQWTSASSGGTTHPVGSLLHNAFGLHDWEGNVWEWSSGIDSINVGIGTPIWELHRIALGGSYMRIGSVSQDFRAPSDIQDETHAGVRFIRNTSAPPLSVGPRPCR